MRNLLDFSSWQSLLTTVIGLLLATLLMVGIRLVFMQTIQRRRERENRQINERLKTLIAAYKTLGGSFTGQLQVSPLHMRDLRDAPGQEPDEAAPASSDRQRRMRDAVEAALSDVILLGTQEQVALAVCAAQDMVQDRSIETAALVVSLRQFIREALDLEPLPEALAVPPQGPLRSGSTGGSGRGGAGKAAGGARAGGGGMNGGGAGGGMGAMALGAGAHHAATGAPGVPDTP